VLDARGDAIGVQTNNVAEYTALLNGLRRAAELGVTEVEVVSDSELMVKQMRGEYKIKNAALRDLSLEATRLARALGTVTVHGCPSRAQPARRPARERRTRRRTLIAVPLGVAIVMGDDGRAHLFLCLPACFCLPLLPVRGIE